jgi:hypothetical protein
MTTLPWEPEDSPPPDDERGGDDETVIYRRPDALSDGAPGGILGDIVSMIAPHVEPNAEAIALQLVTMAGVSIGWTPHVRVGQAHHRCNLFTLVVGQTGSAKGMSFSEASGVIHRADEGFRRLIRSGIQSGEGVIHAIRDGQPEPEPISGQQRRRPPVDSGVTDKRLLIVETEFSHVLHVMERKGSTVAAVLRNAWDGNTLGTTSKASSERATDPHVALIGHITAGELRRLSDPDNVSNGLLNRFLFCHAERVRSVPLPDVAYVETLRPLIDRLRVQLAAARAIGTVAMDPDAEELWRGRYESLRESADLGLLGSLLQRGATHVLRVALVLAVIDGSRAIGRRHLEQALELWAYAAQSARYVFGHVVGDPKAAKLLAALRAAGRAGLSRSEISAVFRRHETRAALDELIRTLYNARRIEQVPAESPSTPGRPSERWRACSLFSHRRAEGCDSPSAPAQRTSEASSHTFAFSHGNARKREGETDEPQPRERSERKEEKREEEDLRASMDHQPPGVFSHLDAKESANNRNKSALPGGLDSAALSEGVTQFFDLDEEELPDEPAF